MNLCRGAAWKITCLRVCILCTYFALPIYMIFQFNIIMFAITPFSLASSFLFVQNNILFFIACFSTRGSLIAND